MGHVRSISYSLHAPLLILHVDGMFSLLYQCCKFLLPIRDVSGHVTKCMYSGIEQVPVVAIMTTGGGTRALTAMYAHLLSVQEMNVLDCVSYITGLSGTTW